MIIASQHAHEDPERCPTPAWPKDCLVQWGECGLVFSPKGNYQTAFFEAFPADSKPSGFIRGEGNTIADAEADAFHKYTKQMLCTDHHWGRCGYTNGLRRCRKCGASHPEMTQPVKILGEHLKPVPRVIAKHLDRPDDELIFTAEHLRLLRLRMKVFGVESQSTDGSE